MEKYSKAVSEMYSQFEKREAHPMEKYIGRLAKCNGEKLEVVGYRDNECNFPLIVEVSKLGGWYCEFLDPQDVVVKECERYWYVSVNDLID
jgi:hypothetical protein|nr:MAG TPA: hypothetical protein [Caudoviricetes sp.]